MRRTHYRNGDEITLFENGCDGCEILVINGILCHERGCPDAWKDTALECWECGCDFYPTERHQKSCQDCLIDWADAIQGEEEDASESV